MPRIPRVSVLLPCYNAQETLNQSIDSLDAQTFEDFEVIAVDDGSNDQTHDILKAWAARTPRITVQSIPHAGIVPALSAAASVSSGEFLARMDADDIALPERLARQVELMDSQTHLALCGTNVEYFPQELVRDGARRYQKWINGITRSDQMENDLFVECPIPHPTLMMKRAAFERVGGYVQTDWPEDYDLILRFWANGMKMGKVPEVLLRWREHPDRLSRTDTRYSDGAFRRCKVQYLGKRIGERSVVVWGAGPVGKAFARELLGQSHRVVAFVDLDPRKIGQRIYDIPVIPPSEIKGYRNSYVVAAVGSATARSQIRTDLAAAGFREPEEFCAVA